MIAYAFFLFYIIKYMMVNKVKSQTVFGIHDSPARESIFIGR